MIKDVSYVFINLHLPLCVTTLNEQDFATDTVAVRTNYCWIIKIYPLCLSLTSSSSSLIHYIKELWAQPSPREYFYDLESLYDRLSLYVPVHLHICTLSYLHFRSLSPTFSPTLSPTLSPWVL